MIPIHDYPGPRRRVPWVTWGLLLINIGLFLYQISLGSATQTFLFAYALVPKAIAEGIPQTSLPEAPPTLPFQTPEPVYVTFMTSMFLHAGWLHLAGNMLFLYIFGDNVEDRMGHLPYLLFYFVCGIVASLAQFAIHPDSPVPSLGASGAIAGVLAAYLVLFPWAKVKTVIFLFLFFTLVNLPAIVLIGLWFVLQFFSGVASLATVQQSMGGVAYFAHIGGFITGLLITLAARSRIKPPSPQSYPAFPRYPYQSRPRHF
jgi:membrane associated rhomboid family serine protease